MLNNQPIETILEKNIYEENAFVLKTVGCFEHEP